MASRSASPGGALLRASRVFSIPPPLPRPMGDLSAKAVFSSDTATLPHPIHQSITTPQASLMRGDWGFKRPLPLRATTKTSTPIIRVEAIDTFEHITEFNSAADHSINLRKWQQMGIPLTTPMPDTNRGLFKGGDQQSVFEAELDTIAGADETPGRADTRWKFKGPWLAGQTEGDFNTFLTFEVRKRKSEFQKYLKTACAKRLTIEARQNAEGEVPPMVEESSITEEQFTDFVRGLRNTRAELYRLIRDFLDLPPAPANNPRLLEAIMQRDKLDTQDADNALPLSNSPYADTGPPKTHPSAGLAYGLTSAHTYNHPTFGPQKFAPPISARVIKPKGVTTGAFGAALGVGGFVTDLPAGHDSFNMGSSRYNKPKTREPSGIQYVDPLKVGGSKMWVHPTSARVDSKGRVVLSVQAGDPQAVAVKEGTTDKIPLQTTPRLGSRASGLTSQPTFGRLGAGAEGHGLKLGGRGQRVRDGGSDPSSSLAGL
ncbi:hypothetical protein VTL71DRAFT_2207 [Oculimacula yallundae]|uniref:Uncharacterized protein n=1 Tax=Oculimacula yallundae TaxID=86028 RepID=A0ABR4CA62_9HELO